jgi:hypothetical protein
MDQKILKGIRYPVLSDLQKQLVTVRKSGEDESMFSYRRHVE